MGMLKSALVITGFGISAGYAYLRHIQLRQGPNRLNWTYHVFGHRGCMNVPDIPENSIASIEYAAAQGAAGVEIDIRITKDNRIVVVHDNFIFSTFERPHVAPATVFSATARSEESAATTTTTPSSSKEKKPEEDGEEGDDEVGSKNLHDSCESTVNASDAVSWDILEHNNNPCISDVTLDMLKTLPYRDCKNRHYRISTLEEVVQHCERNYMNILIEIKEVRRPKVCVDELLRLYQKYPEFMYNNTTVIAFSPFLLYSLRKQNPKIAVCQIYSGKVLGVWASGTVDHCPTFLKYGTKYWDWLLMYVQSRIAPWVIGTSMVGPNYTFFNPDMKQMWMGRRNAVYLWGFTNPHECTEEMRTKGVLIAADDKHAVYYPVAENE